MNGSRYLLDTNAVIYLLQGFKKDINNLIHNAEWVGISVITYIEFLAFNELSENDKNLFYEFCTRINIDNITFDDKEKIDKIIEIRKMRKSRKERIKKGVLMEAIKKIKSL